MRLLLITRTDRAVTRATLTVSASSSWDCRALGLSSLWSLGLGSQDSDRASNPVTGVAAAGLKR